MNEISNMMDRGGKLKDVALIINCHHDRVLVCIKCGDVLILKMLVIVWKNRPVK